MPSERLFVSPQLSRSSSGESTPIPTTQQDSFEISYLNDYPNLPADAPSGSPHILELQRLNLESIDQALLCTNLHMADFVATILYNHSPETLTEFLLTEFDCKKVFHFRRREKVRDGNLEFVILREKKEKRQVRIGLYGLDYKERCCWHEQHVYDISDLATGMWTPVCWIGRADVATASKYDRDYVIENGRKFAIDMLCDQKVWVETETSVAEVKKYYSPL